MRLLLRLGFGAILILLGGSAASAGTFLFAGTFVQDDNQAAFNFTLNSASSSVILSTDSYASGGFPTVLSLFGPPLLAAGDPSLLQFNDGPNGGPCGPRGTNSVTGLCLDAYLGPVTLDAGTYLVIVTEQENLPNGPDLAAGFDFSGTGNFTALGGNPGPFADPSNPAITDTGNWAVSFQNVDSAGQAVPEQATALSLLAGLGILTGMRRRLNKN